MNRFNKLLTVVFKNPYSAFAKFKSSLIAVDFKLFIKSNNYNIIVITIIEIMYNLGGQKYGQ